MIYISLTQYNARIGSSGLENYLPVMVKI